MEKIDNLILSLAEKNILLGVSEGELVVNAPKGALTAELIGMIRQHKEALIAFLSVHTAAAQNVGSIPVTPEQECYELSPAQRRFWMLSQLEDGNRAYNIIRQYVFEGALNAEALEGAFNRTIRRHEILRTVFRKDTQEEIKQFILQPDSAGFKISCHDLSKEQDPATAAQHLVNADSHYAFDLAVWPLLHASLLRMSDNQWIFSCVMHHIIGDAWSIEILVRELIACYNAAVTGEDDSLAPLRIQYRDYAAWLQQQLSGEKWLYHHNYWSRQLKGELPVLQLPSGRRRPPVKTFNGSVIHSSIAQATADALKIQLQERNASLFMGLLTAVNILLYRYSGQHDIIIGTPVAGREHIDLQGQIGIYLNTLALRSRFDGKDNFGQILSHIRQVTLDAYEHQLYPFDELVAGLDLRRDPGHSPLFDVMVDLHNTAGVADNSNLQDLGNLRVSPYNETEKGMSKFDLTFFFTETDRGLLMDLEYNTDVYTESMAQQMARHFGQLLAAALAHPDKPVSTLDYLDHAEKQLLLQAAADVPEFPSGKTVTALFDDQVREKPNHIALLSEGRSITFRHLASQSDKLAHYLGTRYETKSGDIIGILLDRSDNLVIALLAVLKAGAAYVIIDPVYPAAKKAHMMSDAGMKVLITQTDHRADFKDYGGNIFSIDVQLDILNEPAEKFTATGKPEDIACISYTSVNGQLVGVMVSHRALVEACYSILTDTNIRSCTTFGLMSSVAEAPGMTALYIALLSGETLHMFSAAEAADMTTIRAANDNNIPIPKPEHCLIFSGALPTSDITSRIDAPLVYSLYAHQEIPLGKLLTVINERHVVPPQAGAIVRILDQHQNLLPAEVPGEIYIGGTGLADGYHHHPQLTAERFVQDPFLPSSRLFRTNDAGFRQADGTVVVLGSMDREALPQYDEQLAETADAYIPPRNQVEEEIARIWKEVLNVERVSVKDNFFSSGGHSINAIKFFSRIGKIFKVNYKLDSLFDRPVLEEIAGEIATLLAREEDAKEPDVIAPLPASDAGYPLSSSQQRLWVMSQLEEGSTGYNTSGAFRLEGELDMNAVKKTLNALIERHEILRTVFREDQDSMIRQWVLPPEEIPFRQGLHDLRHIHEQDDTLNNLIYRICNEPFDLTTGPLLRAHLFHLAEGQWVFLYVMHHIISDGASMGVLITEFLQLYNHLVKGQDSPLKPLRFHYKDYAGWQQQQLEGTSINQHRDYWMNRFRNGIPLMDLSRKMRPAFFSYKGKQHTFFIDAVTTKKLAEITRAANGTTFMSLLLFVKLLVHKYTGERTIMTGASFNNRDQQELENQIGLYLNNLPLVTGITDNMSLTELYAAVKDTVLGAMQHQVYPLDQLMNDIGYRTDKSRPGLFNILVEWQTHVEEIKEQEMEGLTVKPFTQERNVSIFDISFDFQQAEDEIFAAITYNTDLFDERDILLLKKRLLQLIANVTASYNGDIRIDQLDYKLETEKVLALDGLHNADTQEAF